MIQTVNKYPIDEILKKDASFYYVIPKYQREYTWSYKEWDALYDDITENLEGYFIGSIICINTGDSTYPRLEVIDGQQRLTTLCLFLLALYHHLNKYKEEMDEDEIFQNKDLIKFYVQMCYQFSFRGVGDWLKMAIDLVNKAIKGNLLEYISISNPIYYYFYIKND